MLTDTSVRNARPKTKLYKLSDSRGLHVEVTPTGGKWWRIKYRYGGKEKRLSLGVYPDVSLKMARERRDDARKLLADGIDPSANRKAVKSARAERAANGFEVLAREWFAKHSANWASAHAKRVIRGLERDIFPWIGDRAVADIAASDLLPVLRRIETRGALETAHRALGTCAQIFRYAVATGRAERDPSGDLRGALPPTKGGHFAAVTEPGRVAQLLRAIDGYQGTLPVQCALRLAPLVFVRPGELRRALWSDINLDAAEWRFRVSKTDVSHIVPLSRQAVAILRELHPVTRHSQYVFPSARSPKRPMSDNAVLAALRRMGITKEETCGHGFRAMARTILEEVLGVRGDLIEHQLAHSVRDPNGRAYNRTSFLAERRDFMQQWSDYLDKLRATPTQ